VSADLDFFDSMQRALKFYHHFIQFMKRSEAPFMALSYEKALIQPEVVVRGLVDFLGVAVAEDAIVEATKFIAPSPIQYLRDSVTRNVAPVDE
jgi:hypothetical protein